MSGLQSLYNYFGRQSVQDATNINKQQQKTITKLTEEKQHLNNQLSLNKHAIKKNNTDIDKLKATTTQDFAINTIHERNLQAHINNLELTISEHTKQLITNDNMIKLIILQLAGANKLIALNMFAVVRLELGACVDKIINDALTVKRLHTGSGNLKIASECATAVAMMAGNVLSAGGLSAVGQIVTGSASALNALVHNNPNGVAKGGAQAAEAGLDAGKIEDKIKLAAELQETASNAFNLIHLEVFKHFENKDEIKFVPTKNKTALIVPHGAGGTSAITYDVKFAITKAYSDMIQQLNQELVKLSANKTDSVTPSYEGILQKLTGTDEAKIQHKNSLHPLTSHVICNALQALKDESTEYKKVQGASRSASGMNQLGYAKHAVMNYYSHLKGSFQHTGSLEVNPSYLSSKEQRLSSNMHYDKYDEKGELIGAAADSRLGSYNKYGELFTNL